MLRARPERDTPVLASRPCRWPVDDGRHREVPNQARSRALPGLAHRTAAYRPRIRSRSRESPSRPLHPRRLLHRHGNPLIDRPRCKTPPLPSCARAHAGAVPTPRRDDDAGARSVSRDASATRKHQRRAGSSGRPPPRVEGTAVLPPARRARLAAARRVVAPSRPRARTSACSTVKSCRSKTRVDGPDSAPPRPTGALRAEVESSRWR